MLFLALCANSKQVCDFPFELCCLSVVFVVLPMTDGLSFDCKILRQALYARESPPPSPLSENSAAAAGPAVPGGAESVADGSYEAGFRQLGEAG